MKTGSISGNAGVDSLALTQLVGRASTRVMLQITVDAGVLYVTDQPNAAPGTGYPVTPQAPLVLTEEDHGDLVTHTFYGSSSGATANAGTIEIFGDGSQRTGSFG